MPLVLIAHALGMDCGNRAGNPFGLDDGADQRRPGCRHLSQQCACCVQHACLQSPLLCSLMRMCSPHPTPTALLNDFVLQLHISVKSMNSVGVWDRCRDRLRQPCRLPDPDHRLLQFARHSCRHPFPSLCDVCVSMPHSGSAQPTSLNLHCMLFVSVLSRR